ncbi:hypothetical protein ABIE21_001071 [Conyzicola nivalis]|uniref:Schlafen AlbA-2 domain-containing protein n=1 Tax=Conyzicola nivalis TaxID=1477021 RepID=A0ABV2QKM4_9MICO
MNATQLEALVLEAVSRVQADGAREDDRIEFKRDWPDDKKARQLAGAANRSRGEWLVYVIGLDEKDGSIHSTATVDPADWWAQMESAFDEAAPELVRHLNIHVSEFDSVVALLFRTDRTPYVVKVPNGGAEREVPIRVGTRTRSAHRHELLQLLLPSAPVPILDALSASLRLGRPNYLGHDSNSIVQMSLDCQIYFEHLAPHPAFLPRHLARIAILGGNLRDWTEIHYSRPTNGPVVNFGVAMRADGIELSGPGTANIEATWTFPRERLSELGEVDSWRLRLEFGVAGTSRPAILEVEARHRTEELDASLAADGLFATGYLWTAHP